MLEAAVPRPWTAERIESDVLDALVGALAQISHVSSSPVQGRVRLTRDAIAWARDRGFDVSVNALCKRTGRSRRALEQAFHQVVGVSPARYFRQARLGRAYMELAHARPEQTTVAQVAMRWGFAELGRFAGAYRQWFGELPSHTLARPALHSPGLPGLRSFTRDVTPAR